METATLEGCRAKIKALDADRARLANPKEQKRLAHEAVRSANRLRDDALKAKEDNDKKIAADEVAISEAQDRLITLKALVPTLREKHTQLNLAAEAKYAE